MSSVLFLCIFLPLFASIIVAIFGKKLGKRGAQCICCMAVVVSAGISCFVLDRVIGDGLTQNISLVNWIESGALTVSWGIYVDPLSAVMIFVVTTVSALVHIYSVGYMANDPHVERFMCYLSLFTFSMLILVVSDNFIQLFFGWEGVGLCSYLLIGFWNTKPKANNAAIKAFLLNRIGDLGLVLGIFAVFSVFGSVQFLHVFSLAPDLAGQEFEFAGGNWNAITLICLLLFFGAMGKSAQIGLHTWLPDAMEGPTPVSALIHAATMVTAGVFLVARCSPLFELSDTALLVVTVVGGMTAFMAASIALVQTDIKRVIAYSTCSQLGYMFFACGLSAYSVAIFHLFTHAFFKALLFLGAGSVIHAMSGEQDMRKMGGIWRLIPTTYILMLIGSWALIGLPPFSGYFSKDLILETAHSAGSWVGITVFWLGTLVVAMTAVYSLKVIIMSFHGGLLADEKVVAHIHESPASMLIPLFFLAFGAVSAGYLGLGMVDAHGSFWNGSLFVSEDHHGIKYTHHSPLWVKTLPIFMTLAGLAAAWLLVAKFPDYLVHLTTKWKFLYRVLVQKWYFDYIYDVVLVAKIKQTSKGLWKSIDVAVIDALGPEGLAAAVLGVSRRVSRVQTGYIFHYAFAMVIGLTFLLSLYFFLPGNLSQ